MKIWIAIVTVVLVLGVVSFGLVFGNLNNQIATLNSQVSSLNGSVSALQKSPVSVASPATPITPAPSVTAATAPAVNTPAPAISNAMVNLIPQIEPSIVRIDVVGPGFTAGGSGEIIRNDGYIITNAHVIESATKISVTLKNGQQYTATPLSSDANIDLALLKLSGSPSNLTPVILGTPSEAVIGVSVVAGGFPLGSDLPGPATFSRGIISAMRTVGGQSYVQTDANINPGNSGGGLFTLDGKLIGIVSSAILPRGLDVDGIGLAIPVDTIQAYIQKNLK